MQTLPALAVTAERAALAGGALIAETARRGDDARSFPGTRAKGAGDYVTDTDLASERAIRRVLSETGIPMLGEESGGQPTDRYWVVDPLDGTTNFVHGFPAVGVSVALILDGEPALGVIRAPFLDRTWTGWRDGGAWLDGRRLSVSFSHPTSAVVGTGFPFRRRENVPRYLGAFARALERFEDLRRPGAAALDLAWVAQGVFDGFFELGLGPWDVAAGALLIREAGGVVTDWAGDDRAWLRSGDVLAGSPAVHEVLLEIVSD
jgi:myo-inositol-1(or 4)-monophosphatase